MQTRDLNIRTPWLPKLAPGGKGKESPFIHEFFLVQGAAFRCMAYRDHDGKWRRAFEDDELPGVVRVLG